MKKPTMREVWRRSRALLAARPAVMVPFALLAGVESLLLVLLYLGPRPFFAPLFAPPVRAFFGEEFLHHPMDLVLLPRLFQGAQTLVSLFLGPWAVGETVVRVAASGGARRPGALARYLALFTVGLGSYFWARGGGALVPAILRKIHAAAAALGAPEARTFWGVCVVGAGFAAALSAEVAFVYAAPALMIDGEVMEAAVERSFSLARRNFSTALPIVLVPGFAYFLLALVRTAYLEEWMERFFPEVSLLLLFATIGASFLANLWVVVPAAVHFRMLGEGRQP